MRVKFWQLLLLLAFSSLTGAYAATTIEDIDLAFHWAPVICQDADTDKVNGIETYRVDYITNFDFDNDWNATNNWENLGERNGDEWRYSLKASIYYWVVETLEHWFIGYAIFHPRDWTWYRAQEKGKIFGLTHENDMEGCLLVVKKDNSSAFGILEQMVTQAHGKFRIYTSNNNEIEFFSRSPILYVESGGHGVYGRRRDAYSVVPEKWDDSDPPAEGSFPNFPGRDGIIYIPVKDSSVVVVEEPLERYMKKTGVGISAFYSLRAIDELWDIRFSSNVFVQRGASKEPFEFRAEGQPGGAKAPWGWDYDQQHPALMFFREPAFIANETNVHYLYRSYANANWTFMVYLGADNNLAAAGINDINEMEEVGSTDDVKVIALYDSGNTNTQIYKISKEFPSTNSIISPVVRVYGTNVNSGDPNILKEFIEWTAARYPAHHYSLVLWNHGNAWKQYASPFLSNIMKGIVDDDTFRDHLTMQELKGALRSAKEYLKKSFDVIGLDACLMGAIEVYYQLKDYGDYIVGSEGIITEYGWPYNTILADLVNTPNISGETLANTMVAKYGDYYQNTVKSALLSAVRTASLSSLITAVDLFSQRLIACLPDHRSAIETVRDKVEWYGDNIFIDLYHFAELIKQNISNQAVKNSANRVLADLRDTVIANWHGNEHPNSHGMTIYFTKQDSPSRVYNRIYENLDFSARTQWNEFLKLYLAEILIVFPTQSNPTNAGLKDNPRKIDVKLQVSVTPQITIHGLNENDFRVQIGGKLSVILNVVELTNSYLLEVLPPTQDGYGRYDLTVTMNWLSDTKLSAVIYSEETNADVVLVIDRSGSMDYGYYGPYSYIEPAKNAAKQFVDLMNEGDQIGVVSFSGDATLDFPLQTITPSSPGTVIFSDDMESGYYNWIPTTPWAQITTNFHSPTTCWTDSPYGNYSNYTDTSLTSLYITLPSDGKAHLSFWHHYEMETGYDYGRVQISSDGGSSWAILTSYTGYQYNWSQVVIDLTPYTGRTIRVRFRLVTDYSITKDGWYIDDVEIKTGISDVKKWAKQAIDSIYAGGVTSIGDGLELGRQQLSAHGNIDHSWAMILLSDGYENTPLWVSDVLPSMPVRIDAYTVALGENSDEALLQTIARETGGQYYLSPTGPKLQEIYNLIRGGVLGEEVVVSKSSTIGEGETKVETVQIDPTITRATFGVSWTGSDLDLTLIAPDGTIIDPNVAATDPNIEFISGATYENYTVISPAPGEWKLNIQAVSIPSSGESYTLNITAQSGLTLRAYFDKNQYETNQLITVLVSLSDSLGPIRRANVEVVVQAPQKSLSLWKSVGDGKGDKIPPVPLRKSVSVLKSSRSPDIFQLYDDGAHGDGRANDGIYGNIYANTSNSGSYIFNFAASGQTEDGYPFTRVTQRSVFVAPTQSVASISGNISYLGTRQGIIYIQAWMDDPSMHGSPDYLTSITGPGSYNLPNLPDGTYYLSSYMDINGNGGRDTDEPSGIYGAPRIPNPIVISSGNSASGIDITILPPPTSLIGFPGDGCIGIAWSQDLSKAVTSYRVYYGISSGNYSGVVNTRGVSRSSTIKNARNVVTYELTRLDNSLTYFIAVTSCDDQGNESLYSEEINLSPSTSNIQLQAGWNMISLPRLPLSVYQAGGLTNNLSSILSSIDGKYISVWAYSAGNWLSYDTTVPEFINNLIGFIPNQGYWIYMKEEAELKIGGIDIAEAEIELRSGWNLIGYSLKDSQPISNISSFFTGGYLKSIWTYDPSKRSWSRYDIAVPEFVNNLTTLDTGKAYWIYALQNFTMHLGDGSGSPAPQSSSPITVDIKVPPVQLPPFTIYGTVERNGKVVEKNDNSIVSVIARGKVIASYKIDSEERYKGLYILRIPINLSNTEIGEEVTIHVDEHEVARITIGEPGEIKRLDISYQEMPKFNALLQNYPNPFNAETWIPYQLVEDTNVSIKIYNSFGQLVRTLDLGYKPAGFYINKRRAAYWNGKNEIGEEVSSGVYFYTIRAGKLATTRKMLILK